MGMSKNPNTYIDVKQVLDTALSRTTTRYTLTGPGKARHFLQRIYAYRTLLFNLEQEKIGHVPGYVASTKYDSITCRLDGSAVILSHRQMEGTLSDEDGAAITEAEASDSGTDDDLLETARQAAKGLNLDVG